MVYLKLIQNVHAETEENLKQYRRFWKGDSNPRPPDYEIRELVATSLWWV
jgi:hypothetical protein